MELLNDELRRQLPPIHKDHSHEWHYMIYAKLYTRRSGVSFYVAEGEQHGQDFLLWGMLVAPQFKFPSKFQITVARLRTSDWLGKEPCWRDEDFKPCRWAAIEKTIPMLKQLLDGPRLPLSATKLRRA
jgi:hypothetical protein